MLSGGGCRAAGINREPLDRLSGQARAGFPSRNGQGGNAVATWKLILIACMVAVTVAAKLWVRSGRTYPRIVHIFLTFFCPYVLVTVGFMTWFQESALKGALVIVAAIAMYLSFLWGKNRPGTSGEDTAA